MLKFKKNIKEKIMTGLLFGATFSYGCEAANTFGLTPMLKEYAFSAGKSCSENEIRQALKKLASYFYYLAIAKANEISDPFDLRVVKAHWIGNELLKKVTERHGLWVLKEEGIRHDRFILFCHLKPLIQTGKAHHSFYAKYVGKDVCSITSGEGFFWHLGEKRMPANSEDLQNLAKYSRQ